MSRRFTQRAWCIVLSAAFAASCCTAWQTSSAAPPWGSLLPFKRVEADQSKSYTLVKENGPWMIMAASFSGDEAEKDARELVQELRRDFKAEAYVHHQHYDYSGTVEGLGLNKYGEPKKMRFANGSEVDEYAVLVGNYKSFDDPDSERVLERIRTIQPKAMTKSGKRNPNQINDIREFYRKITKNQEKKQRGPMGKAFITRNPLLPPEETAKGTLDPFVAEMNEGMEFSLLDNKQRFTVQVATFRGASSFNEAEFQKLTSRSTAKIDEAAYNAAKLTAELRKQGVEAYVFHDRHESLVTIGAFDDIGQEMPDGHTELHPQVATIMKKYSAEHKPLPGTDQLGVMPRTLAGVPFDVSPQIIQVPRSTLADVYSQERR